MSERDETPESAFECPGCGKYLSGPWSLHLHMQRCQKALLLEGDEPGELNDRVIHNSKEIEALAVALPERLPTDDNPDQSPDYDEGWNACLDKVKELNQ